MKLRTIFLSLFVALAASSMVACSSSSAPAAEGTGTSAGSTPPVAEKPKAGHVGSYKVVLSADMQKQMDAAAKQLESMKTVDPAKYAEGKAQMDAGMKSIEAMKFEIVDDKTFKMSVPGANPGAMQSAEGTYTMDGTKMVMTLTMIDGKPPTEAKDKAPTNATYDATAGTITLGEGAGAMTFKKA